jgi:hypothetical protein
MAPEVLSTEAFGSAAPEALLLRAGIVAIPRRLLFSSAALIAPALASRMPLVALLTHLSSFRFTGTAVPGSEK